MAGPLLPTLRTASRAAGAVSVTAIGFLVLLLTRGLARISARSALRLRNAAFRLWAKLVCRILRVRLTIEGEVPDTPFFLVANHLGYLDIPLIASALDAAFVAKADLRGWPFLGRTFEAADTIFIDRGRKRDLLRVLDRVDRAMSRDLNIVLFPEGTSGSGETVLPIKPSLLDFAARRGLPVHWATIHYATPPDQLGARNAVCWWGDEALLPHFRRLAQLPRVEATLRFGSAPVTADDRKELAAVLHREMSAAFRPSVAHPADGPDYATR